MKLVLIKIAVILLCVPLYPFYTFFIHMERNSYLGGKTTYKEISIEYWAEVWELITYKKESDL